MVRVKLLWVALWSSALPLDQVPESMSVGQSRNPWGAYSGSLSLAGRMDVCEQGGGGLQAESNGLCDLTDVNRPRTQSSNVQQGWLGRWSRRNIACVSYLDGPPSVL